MYRYRRYSRRPKRDYENQTMSLSIAEKEIAAAGTEFKVVPPVGSTVQGKRVCKYFDLVFSLQLSDQVGTNNIGWLLVYVPEGTTASSINPGSAEKAQTLYEPNQNVIGSGVLNNGYNKSKIRLGRRLNSGDYIALVLYGVFGQLSAGTFKLAITCNYAIAYA